MRMIVFLQGLRVEAEIGCHPHERGRRQPLVIDVELTLAAGPVERLSDTVDYDRVAAAARTLAGSGHIELVESYAARLAQACLLESRVERVRVRVEKPEAVPGARAAGVEMTLER